MNWQVAIYKPLCELKIEEAKKKIIIFNLHSKNGDLQCNAMQIWKGINNEKWVSHGINR